MRKFLTVLISMCFLGSLFMLGCAKKEKEQTEEDLNQYLNSQEQVLEDISVQMGNALWSLYTGEGNADLKTPRQRFYQLFTDATLNTTIENWYAKRDIVKDPVLNRRVLVWRYILRAGKIDFSPDILNITEQIENAAFGKTQLSDEEIKQKVIELIKLRNAKANEEKFKNYATMLLDTNYIGSLWFKDAIDLIDRTTKGQYLSLIKDYKKQQKVKEFIFEDLMKLIAMYNSANYKIDIKKDKVDSLIKETLTGMGIDYNSLNVRIQETQLPPGLTTKTFIVKIPSDNRIAMIKDAKFEDRMYAFGNVIQSSLNKSQYPVLKGYRWLHGGTCEAFNEGVALAAKRFVLNKAWLKKYTGLTDKDYTTIKSESFKYAPAYFRYLISNIMLEMNLYENPDQDIIQLTDTLQQQYLLLEKPNSKPLPRDFWIKIALQPLNQVEIMLGDMIGFHIHTALEKKYGEGYVFNNEVAKFLGQTIFADGELNTWETRIKMIAGFGFDVKLYLRSFGK